MSVKCPSCGFDSPDGAAWCDLCKEPFNKKRAAAPAVKGAAGGGEAGAQGTGAPAASAPAPKAAESSDDEAAKKRAEELLKKLSIEEEPKVPAVPSWARLGAWVFLGLWVIFGFILMGVYMAKYEDARAQAPLADEAR